MEKENARVENEISQQELADKLKISRWSIYRAIKAGKLHPIPRGNKNYFNEDEINEWLKKESL